MAANQGAGVACDLANEFFESAIVLGPLLDLRDQLHRHVERAGAAVRLEGQVPTWLSTARPFKRREAALDERAELGDLTQGRLARAGVSIGDGHVGIELGSVDRGKLRTWFWRGLIPGCLFESLTGQSLDLLLQPTIVANAFLALLSLFGGQGFGSALSLDEAGPAMIRAMEFGRFGFAGAVGFTAGALGGGEAAWQQGEAGLESNLFSFHLS